MKNAIAALLVTGLIGTASTTVNAQGSLNIFFAGALETSLGPITDGTAALIADGGDGVFTDALSGDSFVAGDDILLGLIPIGELSVAGAPPGLFGFAEGTVAYGAEIAGGTPLTLAFFDVAFDPALSGPGFGVEGGILEGLGVTALTDGAGITVTFANSSSPASGFPGLTGTLPDSGVVADFVTVPEPASLALLALGGLMVARRGCKA